MDDKTRQELQDAFKQLKQWKEKEAKDAQNDGLEEITGMLQSDKKLSDKELDREINKAWEGAAVKNYLNKEKRIKKQS